MQKSGSATDQGRILLHRFRLERGLGQGGCGEVHAAFDLLAARRVALKILRADVPDLDLEEGLRAEFRALRALSHPGIVQVHDFARTADGVPFYTMELLEGRDLAADRQDVDPHGFVEQVARALDYLHASGLVHSDLKPSNVFHLAGRFVLTDFGLVRRMQGPRREAPYGTLAYMPPERLRAQDSPPDPREDLYALGAILYELLAGRPPYVGPTPEATLANVLAGDLDRELAAIPEAWARLLRRLLAIDPAARFASAWELLAAWGAQFDRPLAPPQVWSPPFVGRRRELAAIRYALGDLGRGRGGFICVTGAPGIGKSMLLEMASSQAASSGIPCWRIESPATARPLELVEELAHLYRRWRPGLPEEAAAAADQLARWPQSVQETADSDNLVNVHAHALDAMRQVADVAPCMFVVDDAHRLDHASRELLRLLAASVREAGVLFIIGARSGGGDGAGGGTTEIGRDVESARQAGGNVRVLQLRELSLDEVTALVRRRFGAAQELDILARRIFDLTQGHPFFVSEALQNLLATGQLRRDRQGWQIQPQAERQLLPRMADTILSEHVAQAPERDRETFEVLALLPSGSDAAVLGQVLGRPADEVRAALERGVQIGLLEPHDGSYRFGHELIREACAARCQPAVARRLHRRIADALAGTPAEAYHRLAADERSARSRACFLREGRSFENRRAPWEALRCYAAALEVDPLADDADELALRVAGLRIELGETDAASSLLLRRLPRMESSLLRARALHLLGRAAATQGRNDEALFHLQAAAQLFGSHGSADEQRTIAADVVHTLLARGDAPDAIEACKRALAEIPAGQAPEARARLLLQQAQAERQTGDAVAAEATCRQALDELKPLGRTLGLAQTYTEIGRNYAYRGDHEQAERFYRAALKVHTELGDLNGMKNGYNNLGSALMRIDRLEEAIACYQESLALKRRLGDRPGEGSSLNNLGNLWERQGEHRRAFQCYRRGIGIYRRLERPRELATLYNNMAEVHTRLGNFHNAMRLLRRAQEHAAGLGGAYITQVVALNMGATQIDLLEPQAAIRTLTGLLPGLQRARRAGIEAQCHAALALACAWAGDMDHAASHETQALEALEGVAEDEFRLAVLLDLAETAALRGRGDAAELRAREAEALARAGSRPHGHARALRLLAEASREHGDWDVAESRLEEAAALCRTEGFRHELARCYKALGLLHWDLGLRARAAGDFDRCIGLLEELRVRTELGLTYLELAKRGVGGTGNTDDA